MTRAIVTSIKLTLGVGVVGLMLSAQAQAGCGPGAAGVSPSVGYAPSFLQQDFRPAAYLSSDRPLAGLIKTHYDEDWFDGPFARIVGMWKFTFTSKGTKGIPDGAPIDAGYVTWHADGTELMNSGREPKTGSFCMGVWKQVGADTYKLNHFALSWDDSGTVLVGPTNIRETVKLDRAANAYTGNFTLDQFSTDGTTVLAHIVGTISASRITVD